MLKRITTTQIINHRVNELMKVIANSAFYKLPTEDVYYIRLKRTATEIKKHLRKHVRYYKIKKPGA